MALAIRLSRGGRKARPFYRIVVADKRMPRDGRYIEKLGTYNPLLNDDNEQRAQAEAAKAAEEEAKAAAEAEKAAAAEAAAAPAEEAPAEEAKAEDAPAPETAEAPAEENKDA